MSHHHAYNRFYLRNHMSDPSFMREWSMHRMLRRFGLPYLRTRTVRFVCECMCVYVSVCVCVCMHRQRPRTLGILQQSPCAHTEVTLRLNRHRL